MKQLNQIKIPKNIKKMIMYDFYKINKLEKTTSIRSCYKPFFTSMKKNKTKCDIITFRCNSNMMENYPLEIFHFIIDLFEI